MHNTGQPADKHGRCTRLRKAGRNEARYVVSMGCDAGGLSAAPFSYLQENWMGGKGHLGGIYKRLPPPTGLQMSSLIERDF